MVLGMPMTGTPSRWRRRANDRVPSPPTATRLSSRRNWSTCSTASVRSTLPSGPGGGAMLFRCSGTLSAWTSAGLIRELWSTVPPLRSMVRVLATVSGMSHSELSAPWKGTVWSSAAHPRRSPRTSYPASAIRTTSCLIAAFRPGTSPPPVRIPTRFAMRNDRVRSHPSDGHQPVDQVDHAVGVAPFVVVPGDHLDVAVPLGMSRQGVEDGRMRVADDVGGDQRHLAVFDDPGERPRGGLADRIVDVRGRDVLAQPA